MISEIDCVGQDPRTLALLHYPRGVLIQKARQLTAGTRLELVHVNLLSSCRELGTVVTSFHLAVPFARIFFGSFVLASGPRFLLRSRTNASEDAPGIYHTKQRSLAVPTGIPSTPTPTSISDGVCSVDLHAATIFPHHQ